jgi:hypothetical protein
MPNNIPDAIERSLLTADANVVDALRDIASALKSLGNGNAATPMGAVEAHGVAVRESGALASDALQNIADALLAISAGIGEASENMLLGGPTNNAMDMLEHAICMGIRKGLFGCSAPDNASILELRPELAE